MTVIIGINWYTEMLVLADTRVSWPNQSRPPEDILRKLYTITDHRKTAVLGFSGNIQAAQFVMQYLMEKKFRHIRRKLVIERLKDNLRFWLEEVATTKLSPEARGSLSFMLCGLEPYRPPFLGKNPEKVLTSHLMNQEIHLYIYRIAKDSGKVNMTKYRNIAITGSGKDMSQEVVEEIHQAIHFGFDQPNIHWARSMIVTQQIAEIFKKSEYNMSVGGPFQTIRITPEGVTEFYTWPPDLEYYDVEVLREPNLTTIYNPKQNKTYKLYPIWGLPPL